jgi:serine/threonine protein kinase
LANAVLSEPISPGTLLGKYEIVHRIALGGMAEIYLARVTGMEGFEKFVVLKRILPQLAAHDEFVRMFFREARVAAALDHANIAHVYDIGEKKGVLFFTMEYLHGEDTRWIARRLAKSGRLLPLEHALGIMIGAASGLHFAHEKKGVDGQPLGIVHRDISPSNIVVTYDGGVKIVDFGVAKISADPELSRRYSLKGKLAYMSPEQLHGQVDRRSDVFSMGIVLYELTTHGRLFKAPNEVETIRLVLDGPVPRPSERVPGYPPELERIVLRAVDRDPARRYATARELQVDLEAFARDAKLQISSAALAEWMEQTFGPKRELWHTLALPPSSGRTLPSSEAETHAAGQGPTASPATRPVPLRPRLRPRRRRTPLALAAVALVALGGAALAFRRGSPAPGAAGDVRRPPAAAVREAVVVVAEKGDVAIEPSAPAAAPVAPARAAAPGPAPATAALPATSRRAHATAGTTRAARTRPAEPFSATFARREPDIRRCFSEAGADSPGGREISLRFEAGKNGHVTSLSVLPPAAAATPLGACLTKVGASTVFAPQPAPVTFRIPLSVKVPRGERPAH